MLVELPCGILYKDEVYDRVRVKELTGRQQNYLIDMELVADNLGHVPKLLMELTEDYQTAEGKPLKLPVEEAIWQLASEDVEFILIKVREATFGPNFAMPVACNHCGHEQKKVIKLDKLETVQLDDKAKRTEEVELPKTKQTAIVTILTLKSLFDLYKLLREKPNQLYTGSLCLSLSQLGEKQKVTAEDLMDLPVTDLQIIEKAFSDLRGSVDLMITHDCDSCKKEFDTPLPVMDPNFFVQSQTPKT